MIVVHPECLLREYGQQVDRRNERRLAEMRTAAANMREFARRFWSETQLIEWMNSERAHGRERHGTA